MRHLLVLHILIGQEKNCVMDLPVDLVDFVNNFMVYQEKTFKIKLCVGILGVEWLTFRVCKSPLSVQFNYSKYLMW